MRKALLAIAATSLLTFSTGLIAQTVANPKTLRWVSANDVRLRQAPSLEGRVIGVLYRGLELNLQNNQPTDGFCLVDGDDHHGYVACQYLTAEKIAKPKAGFDGVDSAQRWVSGNSVVVRDAPMLQGSVTARLSLNAVVKLIQDKQNFGYCEVQLPQGIKGFTACQFLKFEPVSLAKIQGRSRTEAQPLPAGYDPEKAFWLAPSWNALEDYAQYLRIRNPKIPKEGPWPRNEALEKMKAHLDLGLKGSKPKAFSDWSDLKNKANRNLDDYLEVQRLHLQKKIVSSEASKRFDEVRNLARDLNTAIGIWSPFHDPISSEKGVERTFALLRAIELPQIRLSFFASESEVAPPHSSAEDASGRFGIVFRQTVIHHSNTKAPGYAFGAGLYDMNSRIESLVSSVNHVRIFLDGRIQSKPSFIRQTQGLWRDSDAPMCEGYVDGFSFGAADKSIWKFFGDKAAATTQEKLNPNPPDSLYAFYTNRDLPRTRAVRAESVISLDREKTGFIRAKLLTYDLDVDGVPDLAVWEGQGLGPGHLGPPPETDDRWYRLVLINIGGFWKVLGSDSFQYGCGC
jgi:hypothetical protein